MNPAMILTWLIGFLLIHSIGLQSLKELWLFTKENLSCYIFNNLSFLSLWLSPEFQF